MLLTCARRAGVVSGAVTGLCGAASSRWDMSIEVMHAGTFESFWDTLSFVVNNIVFFFSGMAIVNFAVRWGLSVLLSMLVQCSIIVHKPL